MDTYSSSAPERLRAKKKKKRGQDKKPGATATQLWTTTAVDKLSKPTGRQTAGPLGILPLRSKN